MAQKPEEMTHLNSHRLVSKDHPRIVFRGRVDLLQSEIVTAQVMLAGEGNHAEIVEELEEILGFLRQMVRSEVLDEPLPQMKLLGLTPEEIHAQSHDPKGAFGVEYMKLPHFSMGLAYALVNKLRAVTRWVEVAAVAAFRHGPTAPQREILKGINRLSSVFHIMMCRILAGRYGH